MSETENLLSRGLKLGHLRLLAALSDTGHLGRAAEASGMAQPAASRLLAELDHILGQPVHARTGRGIALTAAGQALAARAARVLGEMRDAGRELAEIAAGSGGHARIGSVTGPALELVLPATRAARHLHPGNRIEVTVATSDLLAEQLLAGRLDFALGRLPDGPTAQRLTIQPLAEEKVALLVRRDHRLTALPVLRPADLMDFDWVMPGPETLLTRRVTERLTALGLPQPMQHLSTASFLLTLASLRQSNAIAPLSAPVAHSFATGADAPYAVLALDLGIKVEPFGLMTRQGAALPPFARQLARLILAEAERTARSS